MSRGKHYTKGRRKRPALLFLLILLATACAPCRTRITSAPLQFGQVKIHDRGMQFRFARPAESKLKHVLVLYATGDGGWRGTDRALFNWIGSLGYPIAGFNSQQYLRNMTQLSDTTTPRRLALDFEQIIRSSKLALDLPPDTPSILVGFSRGAGLAVVAAGVGTIQSELAGVLAIALTKEEEHVLHYPGRRRGKRVQVETYEYLPRLSRFPVAVIQSTHDHYLPAAKARILFGADSALRQFHAVEAGSHSFRGACVTLKQQTADSLNWITRMAPNLPGESRVQVFSEQAGSLDVAGCSVLRRNAVRPALLLRLGF